MGYVKINISSFPRRRLCKKPTSVIPAKPVPAQAGSRNPVKRTNPQGFSTYNATETLIQSCRTSDNYAKISYSYFVSTIG